MKIINKNGEMTKIETEVFQAKNGAIRVNFGDGTLEIPYFLADKIAYDIKDFDKSLYIKYYEIGIGEKIK